MCMWGGVCGGGGGGWGGVPPTCFFLGTLVGTLACILLEA